MVRPLAAALWSLRSLRSLTTKSAEFRASLATSFEIAETASLRADFALSFLAGVGVGVEAGRCGMSVPRMPRTGPIPVSTELPFLCLPWLPHVSCFRPPARRSICDGHATWRGYVPTSTEPSTLPRLGSVVTVTVAEAALDGMRLSWDEGGSGGERGGGVGGVGGVNGIDREEAGRSPVMSLP